jgi:hypothetical protein
MNSATLCDSSNSVFPNIDELPDLDDLNSEIELDDLNSFPELETEIINNNIIKNLAELKQEKNNKVMNGNTRGNMYYPEMERSMRYSRMEDDMTFGEISNEMNVMNGMSDSNGLNYAEITNEMMPSKNMKNNNMKNMKNNNMNNMKNNNMKMKKKVRINENNLTASQRSMYDMNQVGKQDAKPANCNLLGLNSKDMNNYKKNFYNLYSHQVECPKDCGLNQSGRNLCGMGSTCGNCTNSKNITSDNTIPDTNALNHLALLDNNKKPCVTCTRNGSKNNTVADNLAELNPFMINQYNNLSEEDKKKRS